MCPLGPVKKVRILMDQDTGRPKGFAFVEFHDASSALAAIRHLDGHEVNSRRLRVSYSNNSNLKEVAQTIGPDAIPDFSHLRPEFNAVRCSFHASYNTQAVQSILTISFPHFSPLFT